MQDTRVIAACKHFSESVVPRTTFRHASGSGFRFDAFSTLSCVKKFIVPIHRNPATGVDSQTGDDFNHHSNVERSPPLL